MKKTALIAIAAAVVLLPVAANASGFGLYDASARAMGMSAAFVARADDASAIYYNPAGIAFLDGTNVLMNITPVHPNVEVTFAGETTESEQRWVHVPSVFISKKVTDNLAVGFGMFAPIGLGVQYPETYSGSLVSYRSMGMAVFFRPTIAWQVNDKLAVGGSVDFVYSEMKVFRKLPYGMLGFPIEGSVDSRNEFSGTGTGFSLGALYKATDKLQFGAKYRHKVEIDYEGDVDFTWYSSGISQVDYMLDMLFYDQDATSAITTPSEFTAGVMYRMNDRLSVEADVVWTGWSEVDMIPLNYEVDMICQDWAMNWEDTWMVKFGMEYWMTDDIAFRAGYTKDQSPIPAETLTPFAPDADRNEFTVGLGYDTKERCCWGRFFADAAFRYIMLDDVSSTFAWYPADFSTDMTFFGISVGFSF